ncbi:hypothetical protein J1777_12440, partial [Comamonas denitrificans]
HRREVSSAVPKLRSTPSLRPFLRGQERMSPAGARPGQRTKNQIRKQLPHAKLEHQGKIIKKPRKIKR